MHCQDAASLRPKPGTYYLDGYSASKCRRYIDHLSSEHAVAINRNYLANAGRSKELLSSIHANKAIDADAGRARLRAPLLLEL